MFEFVKELHGLDTLARREIKDTGDVLEIKVSGRVVYASVNGVRGFIDNHHHATIRAIVNDALKVYGARVKGRRTLYGISHYCGARYELEYIN